MTGPLVRGQLKSSYEYDHLLLAPQRVPRRKAGTHERRAVTECYEMLRNITLQFSIATRQRDIKIRCRSNPRLSAGYGYLSGRLSEGYGSLRKATEGFGRQKRHALHTMSASPLPNGPLPEPQASSPRPVDVALHATDATFGSAPAGPLQLAVNSPVAVAATLPPLVPGKRTRCGKIARLATDMRDMVNRMLRNNVPYRRIVSALDEFGIKVSERNVSNWKTCGGYREWCKAQDYAAALHIHQDNIASLIRKDDATQVAEVGLQVAATRLAQFFLTPEADQLAASNPDEYHRRMAALTRLTAELHKLQKYRDDSAKALGRSPERIRRESEESIERTRRNYSSTASKDSEPVLPRNYLPKDP